MSQRAIHTKPTKYNYDNKPWLYRFMYSFFFGFVQHNDYAYDVKPTKKVNISPFTLYSYDTFSVLNYVYNYFCGDMTIRTQYTYDCDSVIAQDIMPCSETGFDYFGARFPIAIGSSDLSIWLSVDPLSDMYPSTSPFMYTLGNPIMMIDPNGMNSTDLYDISSGEHLEHIEDGVDEAIAIDKNVYTALKEDGTLSNKDAKEVGGQSLGTNTEFEDMAATIYAESSGGIDESIGIINVLENRAANQGNSVKEQLSDKSPYGVYGVRDKDRYYNEKGNDADTKRNNVNKAIMLAQNSNTDYSNGAYFWDGTDISDNGHYKVWGVKFSDPSHNLWDLKDTKGSAQLITTEALGKTTFSKFKNQGSKWYMSK